MTLYEMELLKREYGNDMEISGAVHLHDEDEWNEYTISYKGVIVGSELVSREFVKNYISEKFGKGARTNE